MSAWQNIWTGALTILSKYRCLLEWRIREGSSGREVPPECLEWDALEELLLTGHHRRLVNLLDVSGTEVITVRLHKWFKCDFHAACKEL